MVMLLEFQGNDVRSLSLRCAVMAPRMALQIAVERNQDRLAGALGRVVALLYRGRSVIASMRARPADGLDHSLHRHD